MEDVASLLSHEDLLELLESSRDLSERLELQDLLKRILERACKLMDSPDGSVMLHNPKRHTLYFAAVAGNNADILMRDLGELSEGQIPISGSIAGQVFSTGKSALINVLDEDSNHFKGVDAKTHKPTHSLVCTPLRTSDGILGVAQVLNKRTGLYSERDLMLLEQFTTQAAVAIRNARIVDDLAAHMGHYVSREQRAATLDLIEELGRPLHEETLSVMFADLRGSTQLTQSFRDIAKTGKVLREFLQMLTEEVLRHDGIVNKFLGDGLLAIFRGVQPAQRAVLCAIAMVQGFPPLRVAWDSESQSPLDYLDIGIGMATGPVLIGDLGTDKVKEFSVFGEIVNLAAAFERQARDGIRIIADHSTVAAARDLDLELEPMDSFVLKKPDQAVGIPYKRFHVKALQIQIGRKVFLSHNSADKPTARRLAVALRERNMDVWLDESDLVPGRPWQEGLEQAIKEADSALILMGSHGLGRWESRESAALIDEFTRRGMPIIPVLLPGGPAAPDLPLFLRQFSCVDLRDGLSRSALQRLVWGITDQRQA